MMPSFGEAFRYWAKLGLVNFGGPAGQIAMMHRDLVDKRRWISDERFMHALNFCMLLPGPEAQQLAIYVGWLLHGTAGGIVAGAFFVIPSLFVLLGLSYIYAAFGSVPIVAGALWGVKPVVIAIVVEAVIRIGRRALKTRHHFLIAFLAFAAIAFGGVPFPLIVIAAAALGLASARGSVDAMQEPTTPEARPSRVRNLKIVLLWLLLWAAPFAALAAWRGRESLHVAEYLFFTKAAFVTFGGAYGVLAYVSQAAVQSNWIQHTQAMDGLALAETTPGPLIMVLQFVGFMAGWNHPEDLSPATSAVLGAFLTTYATFLPCFFFIFLGAPYVELLRRNRALSGALAGVTAGVVGVILNLAVLFGTTVLWPAGIHGRFDAASAMLSALAISVIARSKLDIAWIVLGGGVIGIVVELGS